MLTHVLAANEQQQTSRSPHVLPTWLYVPVCPRRLVIMHLLYTFARSEKEVEQLVLSETHLGMTVRGGWDGINT